MQSVKPFVIRDAQPDDQAAIREVTLAAYSEYATVMTPSAWDGLHKVVSAALATTVPADYIIAERDGVIIGSVMLFPPEVDAYGGLSKQAAVPELRLLAVTAEARGLGIGRALVEECIRRARLSGAAQLGLHSSKSMVAATHLYESMGFVRFPADDFQPDGAELVTGYRLPLNGNSIGN